MATKPFSFEGHISEKTYAPAIDADSWAGIEKNSILLGSIDHIVGGTHPRAVILINGHRMEYTLWDTPMEEALALIGTQQEFALVGLKVTEKGTYPKLRMIRRG